MKKLVSSLKKLKSSAVGKTISLRLAQLSLFRSASNHAVFKELCFCILTANFNAEGGMRIQSAIGDNFLVYSEAEFSRELKKLGHRFPNVRARFLFAAQKHRDTIKNTLDSFDDALELRSYLAQEIDGLGYKEASHFLRNVGYNDLAIIDFHIIDLLEKHQLIVRPKSLTAKKYLEIESVLGEIAKAAGMTQGELDFYLWYLETGKILK